MLSAWVPVALWLVVIAIESTEGMGASHTLEMIWRMLQTIHLPFSMDQLVTFNHVLRKCGHFIGYGMLGIFFVRAWMMTLQVKSLVRALVLGLFCTLCVASADEFHQFFLPGRTGTPRDVALDMTGAVVLAGIAVPAIRRTGEQ